MFHSRTTSLLRPRVVATIGTINSRKVVAHFYHQHISTFPVPIRECRGRNRSYQRSTMSTTSPTPPRKPGVASPEELQAFVQDAGDRLIVVDVRNPDSTVEPGDQKSLAVAALPSSTHRPQARHMMWDRSSNSLQEFSEDVPLDTPIITHCGGGGRGQKAKDYLEQKGYTRVLNGGGPKEAECWAVFGEK